MSTLFLLRHGETVTNIGQIYVGHGDARLSKNGIAQAKSVSKALSQIKFSAIYSSDLSRSYDTARIIAKPHKIEVIKIPEIKERCYGIWEGLSKDKISKEFKALYNIWIKNPNKAKIPCAESLSDLQKRGICVINKLVKKHKSGYFLVVGHGGINRVILFHYLGINLNYFWRLRQNNCAINIIEFSDHYPKIKLLNGRCFLGQKITSNALD